MSIAKSGTSLSLVRIQVYPLLLLCDPAAIVSVSNDSHDESGRPSAVIGEPKQNLSLSALHDSDLHLVIL